MRFTQEGVLPTLNLPRLSANTNAANNRLKRVIEKREEYALLQEQMSQLPPPSAYISFEEFKQRIKHITLNKLWNIPIEQELVTVSFTSSNYVLPTFETFANKLFYVLIHGFFQKTMSCIFHVIVPFQM